MVSGFRVSRFQGLREFVGIPGFRVAGLLNPEPINRAQGSGFRVRGLHPKPSGI